MATDPHAKVDTFSETAVAAKAAARNGNTRSPTMIVIIK
jgi:hypothetical protein